MSEVFRPAMDDEVDEIVALWDRAGMLRPWNRPLEDIAAIRTNPRSALLVGREGGHMNATVAVEDGGHRAWVYYLCTAPELRGQGWGQRAMAAAEDWARRHGQTKLQLLVRRSNEAVLSFYSRLGYEESAVTVMQKWLDPEMERAFSENPDVH